MTRERMRGAARLVGRRGAGGRHHLSEQGDRLVRAFAVLLLLTAASAIGPALTTQAAGLEPAGQGSPARGRPAADNDDNAEDDDGEREDQSPLARRDPPPNALDDLLDYFDADGDIENTCPTNLAGVDLSAPVLVVAGGQLKDMGSWVFLCLGGFAPNQNVEVRLTAPGVVASPSPSGSSSGGGASSAGGTTPTGEVRRMRLRTDDTGAAEWRWPAVPPGPRGLYGVSAEQGQRRASATFELGPAFSRRVMVAPREARRGETFEVALAGFEPNEHARLLLLRRDGKDWRYLTDVVPAATDANGEAVVKLETTTRDRPGEYLIAAAIPNEPTAYFSFSMFDVRR